MIGLFLGNDYFCPFNEYYPGLPLMENKILQKKSISYLLLFFYFGKTGLPRCARLAES